MILDDPFIYIGSALGLVLSSMQLALFAYFDGASSSVLPIAIAIAIATAIYVNISLSLHIYICVDIYVSIHTCIYIHIYIYIYIVGYMCFRVAVLVHHIIFKLCLYMYIYI